MIQIETALKQYLQDMEEKEPVLTVTPSDPRVPLIRNLTKYAVIDMQDIPFEVSYNRYIHIDNVFTGRIFGIVRQSKI